AALSRRARARRLGRRAGLQRLRGIAASCCVVTPTGVAAGGGCRSPRQRNPLLEGEQDVPIAKINVASVGWSEKQPMSCVPSVPLNVFAGEAWLNKLCYGMYHTANSTPPDTFDGETYDSGKTLNKQYRSLTTFSLEIETGSFGEPKRFRQAPGSKAVLDAGY